MELIANHQVQDMIEDTTNLVQKSSGKFIEANTKSVTLQHLINDTILPVFSKDNELTVSHAEFINSTQEALRNVFPFHQQSIPEIRVSHIIKGRVPSAIGKPKNELLEEDKTLYYERMAFIMKIPSITDVINGNVLSLTSQFVEVGNSPKTGKLNVASTSSLTNPSLLLHETSTVLIETVIPQLTSPAVTVIVPLAVQPLLSVIVTV